MLPEDRSNPGVDETLQQVGGDVQTKISTGLDYASDRLDDIRDGAQGVDIGRAVKKAEEALTHVHRKEKETREHIQRKGKEAREHIQRKGKEAREHIQRKGKEAREHIQRKGKEAREHIQRKGKELFMRFYMTKPGINVG